MWSSKVLMALALAIAVSAAHRTSAEQKTSTKEPVSRHFEDIV